MSSDSDQIAQLQYGVQIEMHVHSLCLDEPWACKTPEQTQHIFLICLP